MFIRCLQVGFQGSAPACVEFEGLREKDILCDAFLLSSKPFGLHALQLEAFIFSWPVKGCLSKFVARILGDH